MKKFQWLALAIVVICGFALFFIWNERQQAELNDNLNEMYEALDNRRPLYSSGEIHLAILGMNDLRDFPSQRDDLVILGGGGNERYVELLLEMNYVGSEYGAWKWRLVRVSNIRPIENSSLKFGDVCGIGRFDFYGSTLLKGGTLKHRGTLNGIRLYEYTAHGDSHGHSFEKFECPSGTIFFDVIM